MGWTRFAIYWVPGGKLGALGAQWLGWDARRSRAVRLPVAKAQGARRYGFHATLKPPFRLAPDRCEADLFRAARAFGSSLAPAEPVRLEIATLGDFHALRPADPTGFADIAGAAMRALDPFRAEPSVDELARRRNAGLTARQESYLATWGYPYVFEEFHPHLTLSDPVAEAGTKAAALHHFGPALDRPHPVDHVSLMGEDGLGRFHVIEDIPLGHSAACESSARSATRTA